MIYMFLGEPSESIKNWLLYNQVNPVEPDPVESDKPLTLTNKSSESAQIKIVPGYWNQTVLASQYQYSINDGIDWIEYNKDDIITLNNNDNVMFKAKNGINNNTVTTSKYDKFQITGSQDIDISGNMQWLINSDTLLNTVNPYQFYNMFIYCTSLTSAPELPAKTLADYCYSSMFESCISLTSAPELPAETLADSCYSSMFESCISLTSAPELPVETLANNCYSSMFRGCTSLTSVPELPAKTLAEGCYSSMFRGCTSLTSVPELPATELADYCYSDMFAGCTSLKSMNFPNIDYNDVINIINSQNMLDGVNKSQVMLYCRDKNAYYK